MGCKDLQEPRKVLWGSWLTTGILFRHLAEMVYNGKRARYLRR